MTTPNLPGATPLTPDVLRAMGLKVSQANQHWSARYRGQLIDVIVFSDGSAGLEERPRARVGASVAWPCRVRTLGKLRQILAALEEEP